MGNQLRRLGDERAQTVPFLALAVVLAGALALGVVRLGGDAVDRARARTAADAAALAGAADGRPAAERVARANGGRLVAYATEDLRVQVTVRVGPATATARAEQVAGNPGLGPPPTLP